MTSHVSAQQQPSVIQCGQLIDGICNKPIPNACIVIENGRIIKVSSVDSIPAAAKIIDLRNYTVLPGLIDAHCHPTIGCCDDYQLDHLKKSSASKALHGLKAVQDLLKAGWTTLRVAGSADVGYADLEIRNAINKGLHEGPRIFGAGHYLSVTGGGGDINNYSSEQKLVPDGLIVDGADSVIKAVRQEAKYGSDWIKLLVTGAFMSAGDNPKDVHFSPDELKAAVEEANRRNLPVMVHAHSTEGIKQAVLSGVRSIEHGTFIDDETINLMVQKGTYLVPTIYIGDYLLEKCPESEAQNKGNELTKRYRERYIASYKRAFEAGVKIGIGTDNVGFPPPQCAREFERLTQIGMTAMQAIQAGTRVNAELLQKQDLIGTIAPGRYADIIAVAKDPLKDISELERVKFVMLGGKVVKFES